MIKYVIINLLTYLKKSHGAPIEKKQFSMSDEAVTVQEQEHICLTTNNINIIGGV